jgi:crotonyl-CoA reductase
MGASIFAAKRGGTVVTCAATSGYMVEFDNRHFWMKLKRLIASHFANYAEAWAANRADRPGPHPAGDGEVYPLDRGRRRGRGQSTRTSRRQARRALPRPSEGQGISDPTNATESAKTRSPASR